MPRTFPLENLLVSHAAARVVAVSRAVGEALVRRGTPRRKLVVIPNGLIGDRVDREVPPASVEEWRRRIAWEPSRRTVGILARPKDQEVVVRALEQIAVPVRLVLAGVDPTSELGRLGGRVPPQHAVVCIPFAQDVRALYELLELILLPSRIEGLSQALLEAMALGKPVIASAAAGNLDLITEDVDGRLVEPLDPTAWARAIEELLSDPARAAQLGTAARRTARETFSLDRTVKQTLDLYRSLVPAS
jgi:glycosyltransferase involved in cell wall biosynthesis